MLKEMAENAFYNGLSQINSLTMSERMNEFETNTHTRLERRRMKTQQQINNTIIVPPAQHTHKHS